MEATAGKEMLRKISAMVAGFSTLSEKVGDKVKGQSPQLIDSSRQNVQTPPHGRDPRATTLEPPWPPEPRARDPTDPPHWCRGRGRGD